MPCRCVAIHDEDEHKLWFQSQPGGLPMITISVLTLTIYLFGFLGSPNEQRIASVAKTLCQKVASNGHRAN